jgi:hypothetical protein
MAGIMEFIRLILRNSFKKVFGALEKSYSAIIIFIVWLIMTVGVDCVALSLL